MATINGTTGNDTLLGTASADSIFRLAGNDTLNGGVGNDTYTIDSTSDQIIEAANAGTDTVLSSVSYTLGSN